MCIASMSHIPQGKDTALGIFSFPAAVFSTSFVKELKVLAVPSHSVIALSKKPTRSLKERIRQIKDKVPAFEEFVIYCQSLNRLIKEISNI